MFSIRLIDNSIAFRMTKREVDGKLISVDDEHLKCDELAREIEITGKSSIYT